MRNLTIVCDNCGSDLTGRVQIAHLSEVRQQMPHGELHMVDEIPTGDYCGLRCLMEVLLATAKRKQAKDADADNSTE